MWMDKMKCKTCSQICVKNGKSGSGEQRYFCSLCKRSYQSNYVYQACKPKVNYKLIALLKEGCGIRSIARLLEISPTTVNDRILFIASKIKQPEIAQGKNYEMDEMCTYVGNKKVRRYVAYALDKQTKQVVSFVVGARTKKTLERLTNTILLSNPKRIFTDKLNIYKSLLPTEIHCTKQYNINHIERNNLTLRTHLKRLNRRTICYSKSSLMLTACLKIYFWD
jgi:IS1 family transposase/transposase-like protein